MIIVGLLVTVPLSVTAGDCLDMERLGGSGQTQLTSLEIYELYKQQFYLNLVPEGTKVTSEVDDYGIVTNYIDAPPEKPIFDFHWNIREPESLSKLPDGRRRLVPQRKTHRDYTGDPGNPQRPLTGVNRILGMHRYFFEFGQSIYQRYTGRVRKEVIKALKKVDETLPEHRLSIGIIFDMKRDDAIPESENRTVFGTMRVFDGSLARGRKDKALPFQRILAERNLDSRASEEATRLSEDFQQRIFEIGKFTLSGTHDVAARARNLLEMFLWWEYAEKFPKGLFYVHVASEAHQRLYKSQYGFEVIETIDIPNSPYKEYVLRTTGESLGAYLAGRIRLPRPNYEILPSLVTDYRYFDPSLGQDFGQP